LAPRALAAGSLAVTLVVSLWVAGPAAATDPQAADPYERVVANVGDAQITGGDLSRRMGKVPPFQLRGFGDDAKEIQRSFLEKVLVRELLLSEGARAAGLAKRPEIRDRVNRILRGAVLAEIRDATLEADPVTDADIKSYYEENKEKFNAPERIAIWRILVETRAEAAALLAELGKDLTPAKWSDLAREESLDKATAMRGGNLGFVAPDGTTSTAGVVVDPALFEAASKVGDVELVSEPVAEGTRFAVVWRRQSMQPVRRSLEQETPSIRQVLSQKKVEKAALDLVAELRKVHVSEHSPELVDQIEMTDFGELHRAGRPGVLPKKRERVGPPKPQPAPGGLR
jgi:peptidyl-prolyl cis-trans isomerase C